MVTLVSFNACLVPIDGPRDEDPRGACANYTAALDRHVRAHPKGSDVPASCPVNCRWWTPVERRIA